MTKRMIDDDFWDDLFVQSLDHDDRYLFLFLWTNKRVRSGGIYEITTRSIANDTGLTEERVKQGLAALEPKVVYSTETGLLWVKNFVLRQCTNPDWFSSAVTSIQSMAAKNPLLCKTALLYLKEGLKKYPDKRRFGTGCTDAVTACLQAVDSLLVSVSVSVSVSDSDKGDIQGGKTEPPPAVSRGRKRSEPDMSTANDVGTTKVSTGLSKGKDVGMASSLPADVVKARRDSPEYLEWCDKRRRGEA